MLSEFHGCYHSPYAQASWKTQDKGQTPERDIRGPPPIFPGTPQNECWMATPLGPSPIPEYM